MKNFIFLILIAFIVITTNCSDFLDKIPEDIRTDEKSGLTETMYYLILQIFTQLFQDTTFIKMIHGWAVLTRLTTHGLFIIHIQSI